MKKILTFSILGICAGIVLFTSCKKTEVTPSSSNNSSSSSSSSADDSSIDPLIGSFTLAGKTYPFYKSKNNVFVFNGQLSAGGTYTTISGANTISGTFTIVAKSSTSTLTAGDYEIINADSTVKAGKALLIGSLITNN
jgi:uncharacterized lipoprotein YajG